ncbi:VOC family protein [Jannaschia sp. W003]|uniref:VOC family protein n=1 Tax=Jannaschia sp. W003 TaxID=2867012 RepID=UPI0021A80F8E|nr:VOC family protein [Jannaschia sp. W003]UWQ19998.1 VOC family protein [Jannaschia sp. W003]
MTPYLHFRGTCAEAFRFYEGVFGGTLSLQRYGDAPEPLPFAGPEDAARVLHAELRGEGWTLMGSDFTFAVEGDPQKAVSIARTVADLATGAALFEALEADGGAPAVPWGPTFFAPGFGMVRDRFGTHWMITAAG